jgi:hypothetical protein
MVRRRRPTYRWGRQSPSHPKPILLNLARLNLARLNLARLNLARLNLALLNLALLNLALLNLALLNLALLNLAAFSGTPWRRPARLFASRLQRQPWRRALGAEARLGHLRR